MRTREELLLTATYAKRTGEHTFEIPSQTQKGKVYRVDISRKTCVDQDGNGCKGMWYYSTCVHYEACALIPYLLRQWEVDDAHSLSSDSVRPCVDAGV